VSQFISLEPILFSSNPSSIQLIKIYFFFRHPLQSNRYSSDFCDNLCSFRDFNSKRDNCHYYCMYRCFVLHLYGCVGCKILSSVFGRCAEKMGMWDCEWGRKSDNFGGLNL